MQPDRKKRRAFPRRWPALRMIDALVARLPKRKARSGIVVLRMFGIGDALLFRAVLEKYAEALNAPMTDITVLGSTAWKTAAPFFGDIKIIFIDERRFARNFFYRLRMMCNIRRRGFKTAVCGMRLRNPLVVESLILASGADRTIIASPRADEKFDRLYSHYAPRMTHVVMQHEAEKPRMADGAPLPLMHEITQQLMFLSAIAGRGIGLDKLPKLSPSPLGGEGLGWGVQQGMPSQSAKQAVLNIGASHMPRRWPLKFFMEIAEKLAGQGWRVTILGGPSETGVKQELENLKPTKNERIAIAINQFGFIEAAKLIAGSDLVVSNDSGLGHLAIMLEKPAVILLGGGHYGSFMPYPAHLTPAHVRFLTHPMPCYHCNWNCTEMQPGGKTFPCVGEILAEQAWQAIMDIQR